MQFLVILCLKILDHRTDNFVVANKAFLSMTAVENAHLGSSIVAFQVVDYTIYFWRTAEPICKAQRRKTEPNWQRRSLWNKSSGLLSSTLGTRAEMVATEDGDNAMCLHGLSPKAKGSPKVSETPFHF